MQEMFYMAHTIKCSEQMEKYFVIIPGKELLYEETMYFFYFGYSDADTYRLQKI